MEIYVNVLQHLPSKIVIAQYLSKIEFKKDDLDILNKYIENLDNIRAK